MTGGGRCRTTPGGMEPSDEDIERTLADVVCAVEGKGIPYLLMGGAGTVTFGRCRATDDIDIFVRVDDADGVLEVLDAAGFETTKTELTWLHKAFRHGVLVDVIYARPAVSSSTMRCCGGGSGGPTGAPRRPSCAPRTWSSSRRLCPARRPHATGTTPCP